MHMDERVQSRGSVFRWVLKGDVCVRESGLSFWVPAACFGPRFSQCIDVVLFCHSEVNGSGGSPPQFTLGWERETAIGAIPQSPSHEH